MGEIMVVSTKGQITLPARLRSKFGIKAGDRVVGEYLEDSFVIKKPKDFFSLKGSLSGGKMPDNEEDLLNRETGRYILERK
jgi:AbrB family looped-hinge helix DNA binding protein